MLCLIYLVYRGGGDIGCREMDGSRDVYGGGIGRWFSVLGPSNGPPAARRWWPNNFHKPNCNVYTAFIYFVYLYGYQFSYNKKYLDYLMTLMLHFLHSLQWYWRFLYLHWHLYHYLPHLNHRPSFFCYHILYWFSRRL